MRFDKIILVGSNKAACDCLNIICRNVDSCMVYVLETSNDPISMLNKYCSKNAVAYLHNTDKNAITSFLETETEHNSTLIVSANNRYIFKRNLISRSNVEIINFHYALLPDYRGMNIPSWVIYNGEKETGVTWHYVTEEIDHGKILNQKRININDYTTAFDITREGMRLSGIGFAEFFTEIIDHKIEGENVTYPQNSKIYLSKDLPNNGYINIYDPISVIDRTLRAFDYSRLNILPRLKFKDYDNYYTILSYNIERQFDVSNVRSLEIRKTDDNIIYIGDSMRITIRMLKDL